jgi:hypothetical protein
MENRDRVEMDADLRQVVCFMQENLPTDKLVQVAIKIGGLAPLLWGKFPQQEVQALRVHAEVISAGQIQSSANE